MVKSSLPHRRRCRSTSGPKTHPPAGSHLRGSRVILLAAALAGAAVLASAPSVRAGGAGRGNTIDAVEVAGHGALTVIRVRGSRTPTFSAYTLDRPARVVIDVSGAVLGDAAGAEASSGGKAGEPASWSVNSWAVQRVTAHEAGQGARHLVRLVVALARPSGYRVLTQGHDLVVRVTAHEPAPAAAVAVAVADRASRARTQAALADARAARAEAARAKDELEKARNDAASARAEADKARTDARRMMEQAGAIRAQADNLARRARGDVAAARAQVAKARAEAVKRAHQASQRLAQAETIQHQAEAELAQAGKARAAAAAESARAAASARSATLAEREAEARRAEADKAAAEAARARTAARSAAGARRADAARLAQAAETAAHAAETRRQAAESAEQEAAARRAEAERAAVQAEQRKKQVEGAIAAAEAARDKAESERQSAEAARLRADKQRAAAEAQARAASQRATQLSQAAAEAEQRAKAARALRAREEAALASAEAARREADKRRAAAEKARATLESELARTQQAAAAAVAQRRAAEVAAARAAAAERERKSAHEIARARAEADKLNRARAQADKELAARQAAVAAQRAALDTLMKDRDRAAQALATTEAAAHRAAQRRAAEEADLAHLADMRSQAEAELAAAKKERAALAAERARAGRELEASRKKADRALAEARQEAARARAEARQEAARARAEAHKATAEATAERDKAAAERRKVEAEWAAAARERMEARRRAEQAAQAQAEAQREAHEAAAQAAAARAAAERKRAEAARAAAERKQAEAARVAAQAEKERAQAARRQAEVERKQAAGRAQAAAPGRERPRTTDYPSAELASYGSTSAPITQQSVSQLARRRKIYRGRKIDLDFKDADIHNLLRLLSDVGGVSIVVPDDVKATVTVRLRDVPWDQAMEVILASKGLWYRREGNIIRVAPRKELEAEDQAAAERIRAMAEAEPPEPEVYTLNYADANKISKQLTPLLSPKGKIEVDQRTNALIINDIRSHRRRVIDLVRRLDTQTPQIQIEARIVEARTTFVREFGIQWGGNINASAAGGNATGLVFPNSIGLTGGAEDSRTPNGGVVTPSDFAVNLPAAVGTGEGGAIGLSLGSVGGNVNLNLRLSALEDNGSVRIISAPKITTSNNIQASIKSGVSIPISVISANGVQTQFVPADLLLQVTPSVSQGDCSITMNVNVTKNEADFVNTGARGDPSILTKEAKTTILVADGQTSVIGGIYTRNSGVAYSKVPFFGDIPVLGWLFKHQRENDERTEVLVFITPKITNRASLPCQ